MTEDEKWWTVDEVASYLQVRRESLYRWISAGKMEGVACKVGRHWRFHKSDVDKWIRSRGVEDSTEAK